MTELEKIIKNAEEGCYKELDACDLTREESV